MREVVLIGDPGWVESQRGVWSDRVRSLAQQLGLEVTIEPATDPFFGSVGRGRRLVQQLKGLKHEVRTRVGRETVAIASINLHEAFFASRFGLTLPSGRPACSACVAFGLERWAAAVVSQGGEAAAADLAAGEP